MNDDIRSALDGIEPAEGAKDRMMQNILRKAVKRLDRIALQRIFSSAPWAS